MHLTVEQRQPAAPVQRFGLDAQPVEVAGHVGLHTLQTGAGIRHAVSGQTDGNVLGALNAVVTFGNLRFQHFGVIVTDAVESVIRLGDIHLVAAAVTGPAIDKGKLERQRAVKVIEKGTPAAEDGSLILRGRHGVIDVLVFHSFAVKPAGELTHPVRVHGDIGDSLLSGEGRFSRSCGGSFLSFGVSQ